MRLPRLPIDFLQCLLVKLGLHPTQAGGQMRRILIPLVFAALLTVAAIMPAAASGPDGTEKHSGAGCDFT
jgi:hypothetical protein